MMRLLVHPSLRIVLVLILVIATAIITSIQSQHEHGVITGWVADATGLGKFHLANRIWSQGIDFYLDADGSIVPFLNRYGLDPIDRLPCRGIPLASATFAYPAPQNFGLILTPVSRTSSSGLIFWYPAVLNHHYTEADLTESVQIYYDIYNDAELTKSELEHALLNELAYAVAFRRGHALTHSSSKFTFNTPKLLIELAYYALFAWWILTLIYARKVWPKPDNSRCPKCAYSTTGLTSNTCPECGTALPSPREA